MSSSGPKQATHSWLNTFPLLVLPPLLWAGNFVVGRAVRDDIPPMSLSFGRWVIALLIILPFAWKLMQRDWRLYWQHRWLVIGTGIVGVASFNTLIYAGLHSTTTNNALLLNSCIPVLIVMMGCLFYRQKLQLMQVLGLSISLIGVLTIILHGDLSRLLQLAFNPGDILVFTAMVCWAFYTLWVKAIPASINRTGLMGAQIIIAILCLLPFCLWELSTGAQIVWRTESILALAYVGILPSVVAYLLYTFAVARVGPVRAGLSIHLMPVFGVLLSALFLDERIHTYHLIGISAIAIGLVLSNRK